MSVTQERGSEKPKEIFTECDKCETLNANFDCKGCKKSVKKGIDRRICRGYPIRCDDSACRAFRMIMDCKICNTDFECGSYEDDNFTVTCPTKNCKIQKIYCQYCGEGHLQEASKQKKFSSGDTFSCTFCKKLSTLVRCVGCGYLNQYKGKIKQGEELSCQYDFCKQKMAILKCPDCKKHSVIKYGEIFSCTCAKDKYYYSVCVTSRCYSAAFCSVSKIGDKIFQCKECPKSMMIFPCTATNCKKICPIAVDCIGLVNLLRCKCGKMNFIFNCPKEACKYSVIENPIMSTCPKCNDGAEDFNCSICLTNQKNVVVFENCGHACCSDCFKKISDSNKICHVCRRDISKSFILK